MTTQTESPSGINLPPEVVERVTQKYHEKLCNNIWKLGLHSPLDCPYVQSEPAVYPHKAYCDNCRITMNRWEVLPTEQQDLMRLTVRLVLEANEETV